MRALFTLLIISLGSIKISTCPEPPRMNINFQYNGSIKDIMPTIKEYLESQEYDIIHYAPESGFILTDYKLFKLNTGKVFLALSININDLVVVVGMGKYEIVTSGIGNPDDILKMKTVDKLPYRLQKKIFLPIVDGLEKRGLKLIKTRR
ncbi:hypothetical protein HOA87_01160 [bacterium]|nr:hypothetical protein [bacterium]MBT4250130.1 hypothetical protein [bacterium]MBT5734336.1 hypothetical protein [bacterium]MBT6019242.1 hypothetical protein [bacterium]MBT6776574.1 hypothetical protein [bacterium]